MKNNYHEYSLEDLIEDRSFVAWTLKKENDSEWKSFIEDHPEFRSTAIKAREIILLLRDTYEVLDEESVLEMWQNIDRFDHMHQQKARSLTVRKIVSRAASVLLVISLGTLGYFYLNNPKDAGYRFASVENQGENNEARLVLGGGETITLKKDNSSIMLNSENQVVINNDSIIQLSSKDNNQDNTVSMNEVIIPYGKRSELLLADGTKVWLNAGSRLAFPSKFTEKNREVYLEGEACFKVVKNETQPFIVKTGQINVTVLGTWFDVSAYPADKTIETVLIEGSVVVSKTKMIGFGKSEKILKPLQKASFDRESRDVTVSDEPHAGEVIAWTEGWLQFSRESLNSVFTRIERYYNVKIVLPENFPSSELITGKLDLKESLEEVMRALSDVAKIGYRISGDKIFIDKKIKELQKR